MSAEIHAKHLRAYINDERALMRDVQNIARREAWFKEMDETREVAGHNTAARKGAKNTVMYYEQALVKEAWDETVQTGSVCASCGEEKPLEGGAA